MNGLSPTALLILMTAIAVAAPEPARFESTALVDSFDFARIPKDGQYLFDTETPAGNIAVLDHVLQTGARTILWRNCGGATMRYRSSEESTPRVEAPLDKRRLPDNRPVHGWLRYYESEPDILRHILGVCHQRGLNAGVHWPFEETHWASWTFGAWNFEHPQFWATTAQGQIWAGRCSLAYPEVVAHKLRLVDELLARGMDHLFVDTWRNGAWGPACEYVRPEIERWRKKYHSEPPTDAADPRWCALVAETTHAYFVALRRRLDSSGRKVRLILGVSDVSPLAASPDATLLTRAVDWRQLVKEGVIDTVAIMSVTWDRARPFESTRAIYRDAIDFCAGRCQVLCPVQMYDFTRRGIPSYHAATKLPLHEIPGKLLQLAWEEGADGICMECVDYNNYPPEARSEMRRLLEGPCRFRKERVQPNE